MSRERGSGEGKGECEGGEREGGEEEESVREERGEGGVGWGGEGECERGERGRERGGLRMWERHLQALSPAYHPSWQLS